MLRLFRSISPAVRVSLIVGLVLLVVAGGTHRVLAAPALFLVVDNNGDGTGQLCTAGPSDCSLRSAVQIANANPGSTISFDNDYTITLGSPLDVNAAFTTISNLGVRAIRIDVGGNGQAFVISANDVQIDGLRVYGAGSVSSNIWITGSAVRVIIRNNAIGRNANGGACTFSPIAYGGIYIDSSGGSLAANDARVWIYGNDISCNSGAPGDGITLFGTDRVVIGEDELGNAGGAQGNFIGYNHRGVAMVSGAFTNTLRNSYLTQNSLVGLLITDSASYNTASDSTFFNQFGNGIQIEGGAQSNLIGNATGQPRTRGNQIAFNTGHGIYVSGSGTQLNVVQGNNIGTNATGTVANGNSLHGIVLDNGAAYNQIGFGGQYRNLISGNTGDGVQMLNGAHDNLVQGNIIGVNISGTLALPNLSGVAIFAGAYNNTVGGSVVANLNLIAGNSAYGIYVGDSSTTTNTLSFNDIGYNSLGGGTTGGISLPNASGGIRIFAARHNTIGTGNYIGHNGASGVALDSNASNNTIVNSSVFSNARYGIILDGASTGFNLIAGDSMFNNGLDGIGERNGAVANLWTQISTYNNGGLGIDKLADFGDSANIVDGPFPVITGGSFSGGMVTITGTKTSGLVAELYGVAADPSGYGEGRTYLGQTSAAGATWTLTFAATGLGCYTAFERGLFASSEFGPNSCRTFLPLIRR